MNRIACAAMVVLVAIAAMSPTRASSHREAPLISQDPLADNTDVYAFVSPERPDRVVLISNFIPLQFPSSGPNFWKFDDNVMYEIMVDNTGDAVEDITYQFRFTTQVRNANTFLYNTGAVTSIDDPDLNVRQFVTVARVNGPRRTGARTVMGENLFVMPVNVGISSMRDYNGQLGNGVHNLPAYDARVFAGQREEGFYVDLGATFDLLQHRRGDGLDFTPGDRFALSALPQRRTGRSPTRAQFTLRLLQNPFDAWMRAADYHRETFGCADCKRQLVHFESAGFLRSKAQHMEARKNLRRLGDDPEIRSFPGTAAAPARGFFALEILQRGRKTGL